MSSTPLLEAPSAIVKAPEVDSLVLMFERLAKDPAVDVAKLERLIDMQERIMRHNAEAAFNVAFSAMQPEIPTIVEKAKTDKTTYAPLEDIIDVVRPIIAKHGFSLGFQTEWPDDKTVRVVGILTHAEGHQRKSEFKAGADQTGSKNAIQALASSVSYGKRYTMKDLLCIVTRGEDDDAKNSEKAGRPDIKAPAGFEDWWLDMQASADAGIASLTDSWNKSKAEYRNHVLKADKLAWPALKAKALTVGK